jgi:hypothetical protein
VGAGVKEVAIKGAYFNRASESTPSPTGCEKRGFKPSAREREILLNV